MTCNGRRSVNLLSLRWIVSRPLPRYQGGSLTQADDVLAPFKPPQTCGASGMTKLMEMSDQLEVARIGLSESRIAQCKTARARFAIAPQTERRGEPTPKRDGPAETASPGKHGATGKC